MSLPEPIAERAINLSRLTAKHDFSISLLVPDHNGEALTGQFLTELLLSTVIQVSMEDTSARIEVAVRELARMKRTPDGCSVPNAVASYEGKSFPVALHLD